MTYLLPLLGLASFANGLVLWWLARQAVRHAAEVLADADERYAMAEAERARASAEAVAAVAECRAFSDAARNHLQLAAEHWDNAATAAIEASRAVAVCRDLCAGEMRRAARERAA